MEGNQLIFNGSDNDMEVKVPGSDWLVVARDGEIAHEGLRDADGNAVRSKGGKLTVPHRSALILAREK